MVCDALDGAVGYESLPARSLGLLSAETGCVPSKTIRMVERQEGERDKRPCRLRLIVFQSQWHLFSSFTFFLFSCFRHFGPVLLHVLAEAVILGHASPGSAGFEHWTKSSSGDLPESRPSWPTHCKKDEITHSLESLVLLLMELTHFVSSESAVGCTWRWCRGLSPSWRIQKWKSSLYTGPSWWRQATRPLSSHWTRGWTALPCWDAKHVHILVTVFFWCFAFEKAINLCRTVEKYVPKVEFNWELVI